MGFNHQSLCLSGTALVFICKFKVAGQSQAQPAGRGGVKQRVLNTPMPGGGSMQTPMPPGWKNAEFGGAFATVVRKAGRGAKTKAGSAIVITCAGTY